MNRVSEFGFTEGMIPIEKEINGNEYRAEYYPAGFNVVRAVYHGSKGGVFRYALALKYLNKDVTKEQLFAYIITECYKKDSDLRVNYISYCVDKAFEIKDPDIVETKKIRFLNYAFFLPQKVKASWVSEIKSDLIRNDVEEYYNEMGASATAKDCAEALGISRQTASKYKKLWKKK